MTGSYNIGWGVLPDEFGQREEGFRFAFNVHASLNDFRDAFADELW